jgi:hypothetical protein
MTAGGRIRRSAVVRAVVAVLAVAAAAPLVATDPVRAQLSAAGDTNAVLSFIDAAAGRVEIVRHWPQAPVDVDVYPERPYFWEGCPGPGAIMMLVATPGPVPVPGVHVPQAGDLASVALSLTLPAPAMNPDAAAALRHLASGLRTPGDPAVEAVKALLPLIADLGTYERRGYAVFAFLMWQGWRCSVTVRAVPEGYGIPFVR